MNRRFVRTVLYPLHEFLRGRRTLPLLREFRDTETLSAEGLAALRDRRLGELLRWAGREVPYWRRRFSELGLDPRRCRGVEDLALLPVLDKAEIAAHREEMLADSWRRRAIRLETGGSSGEPLTFYSDKLREASQLAAKLRAREWWGLRLGDRQADLWGSPIEIGAQDRLRVLKDRALNLLLLPAFRLSDESMAGFRRRLERFRPDFLYGYASVHARYARFLESRGEDLLKLGLRAAISTAEMLLPEQREVIERVFGCPVVDEYGCRDGGLIAQQCPEGRMHVAADTLHVEILDEEDRPLPPGRTGVVAVTNFWARAFPMPRYKIGDRAALSPDPCPCGRSLPVLGALEGRVTDTLFTPEGNRVHGLGAMYVIRALPEVRAFQVVQDALDHVEARLVLSPEADRAAVARAVEEGLRRVLGSRMRIDVLSVDEIPVSASGKQRSVVNRISDTDAPGRRDSFV